MLSGLFVNGIRMKEPPQEAADSYVFRLPVIQNLKEVRFQKPVTFFVGENGTGKSTLLEAVAVNFGFNAEGGTKNFSFSSKATHSPLHGSITLMKGPVRPKDGFFLRAESFYNVATEVDRLDEDWPLLDSYGGKSLHSQSHGESFLALVQSRFGGGGLYILDEPEAALSPSRQFTLIARMAELVREGSQFLIATHSPILMAFPDSEILVLDGGVITPTPYEKTEHYRTMKLFMDNPQRMVRMLCQQDDSDD